MNQEKIQQWYSYYWYYLSRGNNRKFIFTTSSENISTARHGVFLVSITFLNFVKIRWNQWIRQKSFKKDSISYQIIFDDTIWKTKLPITRPHKHKTMCFKNYNVTPHKFQMLVASLSWLDLRKSYQVWKQHSSENPSLSRNCILIGCRLKRKFTV